MEQLGEKIGKELEEKLGSGSEFEKQMEKLGETIGKEMESKFGPGSDFEKQMEKLGKELEGKFGEGSEFAEKMKDLGKEMESKFGPGSEFEQKMKKLGEEIKEKHGADSDLAKKVEEKAASSAKACEGPCDGQGWRPPAQDQGARSPDCGIDGTDQGAQVAVGERRQGLTVANSRDGSAVSAATGLDTSTQPDRIDTLSEAGSACLARRVFIF